MKLNAADSLSSSIKNCGFFFPRKIEGFEDPIIVRITQKALPRETGAVCCRHMIHVFVHGTKEAFDQLQ